MNEPTTKPEEKETKVDVDATETAMWKIFVQQLGHELLTYIPYPVYLRQLLSFGMNPKQATHLRIPTDLDRPIDLTPFTNLSSLFYYQPKRVTRIVELDNRNRIPRISKSPVTLTDMTLTKRNNGNLPDWSTCPLKELHLIDIDPYLLVKIMRTFEERSDRYKSKLQRLMMTIGDSIQWGPSVDRAIHSLVGLRHLNIGFRIEASGLSWLDPLKQLESLVISLFLVRDISVKDTLPPLLQELDLRYELRNEKIKTDLGFLHNLCHLTRLKLSFPRNYDRSPFLCYTPTADSVCPWPKLQTFELHGRPNPFSCLDCHILTPASRSCALRNLNMAIDCPHDAKLTIARPLESFSGHSDWLDALCHDSKNGILSLKSIDIEELEPYEWREFNWREFSHLNKMSLQTRLQTGLQTSKFYPILLPHSLIDLKLTAIGYVHVLRTELDDCIHLKTLELSDFMIDHKSNILTRMTSLEVVRVVFGHFYKIPTTYLPFDVLLSRVVLLGETLRVLSLFHYPVCRSSENWTHHLPQLSHCTQLQDLEFKMTFVTNHGRRTDDDHGSHSPVDWIEKLNHLHILRLNDIGSDLPIRITSNGLQELSLLDHNGPILFPSVMPRLNRLDWNFDQDCHDKKKPPFGDCQASSLPSLVFFNTRREIIPCLPVHFREIAPRLQVIRVEDDESDHFVYISMEDIFTNPKHPPIADLSIRTTSHNTRGKR